METSTLSSGTAPKDPGQRNTLFITLSQWATVLSYNFVDVFLPFYIFKISPYSQAETLIWVGVIVGLNGVCLTFTSPMWGSLAHRWSPKRLFLRAQLAHTILYALMAFTSSLHILLLLRFLQGIFGGVSTIGMILVSSASSKDKLSSNMGLFQSFISVGQLLGPPLGTLAAAAFGFRYSFLCGSAILFAGALFCQLKVVDVPTLPKTSEPLKKGFFNKRFLTGWFVCFMVQVQISFLPSILPKVLESFNIYGTRALKLAGIVVMFYTATTALGTFLWPRLANKIGLLRLITWLLVIGGFCQAMLSLAHGLVDFTVIRMFQTGFVAATMSLVMAIFASQQKGALLGFLNASRFAGAAAGPMIATSMLAISGTGSLYCLIGGLTLLSMIAFRLAFSNSTTE
jgi:MFS family permease